VIRLGKATSGELLSNKKGWDSPFLPIEGIYLKLITDRLLSVIPFKTSCFLLLPGKRAFFFATLAFAP